MKDDTVILASLVGATAMTYINQVAVKKQTTIKPLIGMFVAGAILFGVSMWSSPVAVSLAVLVLITSIVLNGAVVFDTIGSVTS